MKHYDRNAFGGIDTVYRLLAAYFIMMSVNMQFIKDKITGFAYFQNTSLLIIILGTAFLWLLLNIICRNLFTMPVLLASLAVYCYLSLKQHKDTYFLFGCIAVLVWVIFCFRFQRPKIHLSNRITWMIIIFLAAAITFLVASVCILKYRDNKTSCFDFGIFSQMFYYMKTTGLPMTTCERNELLSHFAVHVSPIFYLLLPAYMIFPYQETLMVLQCIVTYSGVIPLYLICRKHRISNTASIVFALCYILYPSFTGGCYYYLHENNFLAPLVLWLVYFFEIQDVSYDCRLSRAARTGGLITAAALTLMIKEDAAVYVAVAALFFFIKDAGNRNGNSFFYVLIRSKAFWCFWIAVIYFIIAVIWLSVIGDGAMTGRYRNYIYDNSGSLSIMLIGIMKNPIYVLTQCMTGEKLLFLAYMLLPLALLPVLSVKKSTWILLIPLLLINLMTNNPYQYKIGYQYTFGSGALLIYTAVLNYQKLGMKRYRFLLAAAVSSILIYGFHYDGRLADSWKSYQGKAEYRTILQEASVLIPDDAKLAASTFLVPYYSQRDELYELETTTEICEYYAVDYRNNTVDEAFLDSGTFEEIFKADGVIAIYRLIDWHEGMISSQKAFYNLSRALQMNLQTDIAYELRSKELRSKEPKEIGDFEYYGFPVKRVYSDQHWTKPSEDGSIQAVFMIDVDGELVYMSLKDGTFVTTWSGPTRDKSIIEGNGGWNGGKGAGWTGAAK